MSQRTAEMILKIGVLKISLAQMINAFTGDGHECESCRLQQTTCENNDPETNEDCPVKHARDSLTI